MRPFAPLSADFLRIIDILSPLRENPLTAEKRLVPHLQHKPLSFFRKAFSLTTATQNLLYVLFQHYNEFLKRIFLSDKIKLSVLQCF